MSDFLFIIPSGWAQIDLDYVLTNIPDMPLAGIENWIANGQMEYIAGPLIEHGLIPPNSTVVEARLFNGATFVVRLG